MKTNELRIGNYISFHNVWYKIVGIDKDRVLIEYHNGETDYCHIEYIDPIELTEEVLLKIGFELVNTKRLTGYEMVKELENNVYEFFVFKIFDNNDTLLNIRKQKGGGFEYGEFTKRGIKYLHELQNAYFILTGKELEAEL